MFDESPFLVPDDSVSIMNGTNEGNVCPPFTQTSSTFVSYGSRFVGGISDASVLLLVCCAVSIRKACLLQTFS